MSSKALDVQILSSTHVFPETRGRESKTVAVSIIDSTVSTFARCAAIWYYDPPSNSKARLSTKHLQNSLSKTLNAYPQWTGRASYAPYIANSDHTKRYRRVQLTFNEPMDIGVLFVTATSQRILADVLPDVEIRTKSSKAWDGAQLASHSLYPPGPLSLGDDKNAPDAPSLAIQFTTFSCGSTAISINLTHALADAQSLAQFAKDYASTSRAVLNSEPLPVLTPIFAPNVLDAFAAENIDASSPDPDLQSQARQLPLHRYDNYLTLPDQAYQYTMPRDYDTVAHLPLSPSISIPWTEWDATAKCCHRILHFTSDEVTQLYSRIKSEVKLSKLDVLLAHIWARINSARQLPPRTTTYLDMTLGLRSRVIPPLPTSFLGSPIVSAAVSTTTPASPGTPHSLLDSAIQIRKTLEQFTPSAIAALLHDSAFEVSPQRLWRCFLGTRHVLLTTWLHLGLDGVDFVGVEGSGKLRHVEPVMPACDGLVDVLETIGELKSGHWSRNGVDVSVYLEESAMERLLVDPWLWSGGVTDDSPQ